MNWQGTGTYIQKTAIRRNLGRYDLPDDFYAVNGQAMGTLRTLLYRLVVRHWMNRRVGKIRRGGEVAAGWLAGATRQGG